MFNQATAVAEPLTAESQKQAMRAAESKFRSQFNEDGILEWIFNRVGTESRRFVEFGIGNGKECNTANLAINHGWSGLLMDGNGTDVAKATGFYLSCKEIAANQIRILQAFIDAKNINPLLANHATAGPTDLLSLDIDGNDLWIWKAITKIQPRVVVIEYNAVFGPSRSLSVVYDPKFDRMQFSPTGLYHGASLTALAKVGKEKGYSLIGCESHGVNAFFVLDHLAADAGLIELTPEQAWYEHAWRADRFGPGSSEKQFDMIHELKFVKI